MSDFDKTLLPPTATDLARALDVLEERLFGLPVHLVSKDPAKAPEELLDHLAWEYSVDVWGCDIPLATRRRIVADSPEVHRFKGTVYGLRRAFEMFDFQAEVTEWWQYPAPRIPGTFNVFVSMAQGGVLGGGEINRQLQLARRIIERNAPVSRRFSLGIGLDVQVKPCSGAGFSGRMSDVRPLKVQRTFGATTRARMALYGRVKQTKPLAKKMTITARPTVAAHFTLRMED